MGLSLKQIKPIQEQYINQYMNPNLDYVNMVGISNLKVQREVKKNDFELKKGESLDDLCLGVGFRRQPPMELEFPTEYEGVRVFYEVIGEIRLLG